MFSGEKYFDFIGTILPFEGSIKFIYQLKYKIFYSAIMPVESTSAQVISDRRMNRNFSNDTKNYLKKWMGMLGDANLC
jgi:hypothetical protein